MANVLTRYYENYLKQWSRVGAIAPSSRFLAQAITRHVDPSDTVLEIGAGSGAFTRALAQTVPGSRLHVLEIDHGREHTLRQYTPNVHLAGALDFLDAPPLDLTGAKTVSGLPLLNFPDAFRHTLWRRLLVEEGVASVRQFTYSPMPLFDRDWLATHRLAARRTDFVFLNLPPAFVWEYTRTDRADG